MTTTGTGNDLSRAQWRKSSHSNGGEGACVELASLDSAVAVRDSKNPSNPSLIFGLQGWSTFAKRIKRGTL